MEGTVLGDGGDEVSVMPVVYPRGTVSVSSLGYFSSIGSSSKPSHHSLTISLSEYNIFNSISRKIMEGSENISGHRWIRPGARIRQSKRG